MISESVLKSIVDKIMNQLPEEVIKEHSKKLEETSCNTLKGYDDGIIPDITEVDLGKELDVPNPYDAKGYMEMKSHTPARLGVWRAGPRYTTKTLLRFKADHAAAMDAVWNEVSEDTIKEMGLVSLKTKASDKNEYLTNPETGRDFNEENIKKIISLCKSNPQVQVVIADGLSSTSIEANIRDILPSLSQGLKECGLNQGTPIFVKHGRVGAMDAISEVLSAEVTVLLIGERPGLVTSESMSCYITYKGHRGIAESKRTVISNIHKGGTIAVEAGAHIADIVKLMIKNKVSGIELKL